MTPSITTALNVKITSPLVKIDIFVTKLNDRDFKTMQNIKQNCPVVKTKIISVYQGSVLVNN